MSSTAVIWDPRYLGHDPGLGHPERSERLLAIKKVLDERPVGKKVIRLEPRLATPEEISLIHDFEYVRKIQETAGHDIQLGPDTRVSPKSWEAARLAVGGGGQGSRVDLRCRGAPWRAPNVPKCLRVCEASRPSRGAGPGDGFLYF